MIKSISAGAMIGIGATVYSLCPDKILGPFMFSLGLCGILTFNLDLYTGKVGYLIMQPFANFVQLVKIWFGNLIGISLIATVAIHSRANLVLDCSVRVNDSWLSLFMLAIPCGLLMFAATRFWKERKSYLGVILCVMVFINCGFEHCIADMFYFACDPNVTFIQATRILSAVTIGNTLGGFIGMKTLCNK